MLRWGGHWVWIRIRSKSKRSQARLLFVCACLWCMHTCSLFMCVECIESVLRTVSLFFLLLFVETGSLGDLKLTVFPRVTGPKIAGILLSLCPSVRFRRTLLGLVIRTWVLGLKLRSPWSWNKDSTYWSISTDPKLLFLKASVAQLSRQPWASASCFWQTMFRQRDFLQSLSVSSSRDFSLCFASWNTWRNSMKEAESRTIGGGRNGGPVIQGHKGRECQS